MGKKSKRNPKPQAALDDAELKHNPFAKLAEGLAPPLDPPIGAPRKTAPPEAAPPKSAPLRFDAKIVVRREKKGRGGKTVTRISGLPAGHRDVLAEKLKKSLGCGASLEDEDVLLHGSVVERAAAWLEAEGARRVVRSP